MITKSEQEIVRNWKDIASNPIVSICCITYNHEKFIGAAIDSFLMQQTTFPFEIIIGEDCSTDNTLNIINEYKDRYPSLIQVITCDFNIGMQKIFARTFNTCSGTYIALCEGDDYWTNINKLQKQVDFLENNSDFIICCHRSETFDQSSQAIISSYPNIKQEKDMMIDDLFNANIANTCTFVYRNINIKIPDFFKELKLGDWPLHMLHAEHGKIKYFPDKMATYRVHDNGIWTSTNRIQRLDDAIEVLKYMNEYFEYKYTIQIKRLVNRSIFEKALCCLEINQYSIADQYYQDLCQSNLISLPSKMKYIVKKKYPSIYNLILFFYRKIKRQ
ncbi:MAG: glycosyltransferase [Sulfuricurvum sp.]|nr:glycosyltransferase [Sulfuricurvum sp.]MDD5385939.1 glycosyltransferase [Sulfuricurvum sp.]